MEKAAIIAYIPAKRIAPFAQYGQDFQCMVLLYLICKKSVRIFIGMYSGFSW